MNRSATRFSFTLSSTQRSALALAVVLALGATAWYVTGRSDTQPADTARGTTEANSTMVSRGDLTEELAWDGVLGFADASTFVHRSDGVGVLTSVANEGATVVFGAELYRVDDEPVVLLESDGALWRNMEVGTEGADVEALEAALKAAGYDPDDTVTLDADYTEYTAAMVERFQQDVGQAVTGVVDLGTVALRPKPVRIGEHLVAVGSDLTDGSSVFGISATERLVTIAVDPASRADLGVGETVEVQLPDRSVVDGVVLSISPTFDAETAAFSAQVSVASEAVPAGDQVNVSVSISRLIADDALLVTPEALVAVESRGYEVRVVDNGTEQRIEVAIVGSAGRLVAVESSELSDGATVLIP